MSFFGDLLKKEQESLDRKEKDPQPWSLKLTAEPKKGLKITHNHKLDASLTGQVSSSKIELPTLPYPVLQNAKGHYAFDLKKFEKQLSFDLNKNDDMTNNFVGKWVWTPAKETNVVNVDLKNTFNDLGGVKAQHQSGLIVTKGKDKDTTYEHAHELVLNGGDWQLGAKWEVLKNASKYGMKAAYTTPCKNVLLWLKGDAANPVDKFNSVSVGGSTKMHGFQHLVQLNYHLANDGKNFDGIQGQPVDVQMGHNFKASDATDFQASWQYGKDLTVHNNVTHKLNDNMSARMHQQYTSAKGVDVHMEFAYTL